MSGHMIECVICGGAIDCRQLDQVLLHEHRGLTEAGPTGIVGELVEE